MKKSCPLMQLNYLVVVWFYQTFLSCNEHSFLIGKFSLLNTPITKKDKFLGKKKVFFFSPKDYRISKFAKRM